MCIIGKLGPLAALVPATMILTVSFFVLVSLRKVEAAALRAFGYVIAALLWTSALLVFSGGLVAPRIMKSGPGCGMMNMMKRGMPVMQQSNSAQKMKMSGTQQAEMPKTSTSMCSGNKGIVYKAQDSK